MHLQIPSLFAPNMVLQRNKPIKIYGKGKPGNLVTVEITNAKAQSRVGFNGLWQVTLPPLQPGGPFLLKISSGSEFMNIASIYVGDVWLATGQSNMAWYVDSSQNGEINVKQADQFTRKIFWFKTMSHPMAKPLDAFDPHVGNWVTIDSRNIRQLSAAAYSFAREIYADQKVPIGIIQATVGNTKIRSWMSAESLSLSHNYLEEYKNALRKYASDSLIWYKTGFKLNRNTSDLAGSFGLRIGDGSKPQYQAWFNDRKIINLSGFNYHELSLKSLDNPNIITVRVYTKGLSKSQLKEIDEDLKKTLFYADNQVIPIVKWDYAVVISSDLPSSIYNSMIYPLIPYTVSGILWYQGESDVPEYQKYSELFINFVRDLRMKWDEQLPIFYVQLHSYKSPGEEELLPRFREVQEQLVKAVPDSYIITAVDLANAKANNHSTMNDSVGHRLALAARKYFYHEDDIKYSGPTFSRFEKHGNLMQVYFNNISETLVTNDQSISVSGFSVAGKDQKFYPADAKLESNTIELSSIQVPEPVAVRYAWSDMQRLNLYDSVGLPALPFRTDSW